MLDIFAVFMIIIAIVGVAIGKLPVVRINRATIALLGAAVLVLSGVISLDQAVEAVDFSTIILLFSMMV